MRPPPPQPPSDNRRIFSQSSGATSAYARHLQAASAYLTYYGGEVPTAQPARNERDILEAQHRFLRDDDDDQANSKDEERMLAKSYYDKLFKEFAMVELARWKERMIAMRWRTKDEVLKGKGEFSCANLSCENPEVVDEDPEDSGKEGKDGKGGKGLRGFELNFEYAEDGKTKNALVKVRVCRGCARKLKYTQKERSHSRERRREKDKRAKRKEEDGEEKHERRHRRRERDGEGEDESGRKRSRSRSPERRRRRDKPRAEAQKDTFVSS